MAGQTGAWAPIGAEKTASGYEVAWKVTGADQYSVWNTDSSGNYVSSSVGVVSGSSLALEALEPSFHQDLNNDGTIGVPTTGAGSSGTASLALLTNYMASTFATPAGESTGVLTAAQSPGQDFLTKPAA